MNESNINKQSSLGSEYNRKYYHAETGEYVYRHPHPAVTADCVIFGFDGERLKVLLIERGLEPYKGMWALPGGFMKVADPDGGDFDLSIEETARRELREETNLKNVYLEQFKVYSDADRDPRERVVTVAFIALIRPEDYELLAGDDAANAMWWNFSALPPIAFDHDRIIRDAKAYLEEMLRIKPLAFKLLNDVFSMSELQKVYEAITGISYDRRNFQRKAMQSGIIREAEVSSRQYSECSFDNDVASLSEEERPRSSERKISPRSRKKFFSFNREKDKNEDEEEGSIKDLFNF